MPSEDIVNIKNLFSQYQKSDKAPFIIYADLVWIIEKTDGFKNNPENSSATKESKHIPSGFPMLTRSSLRSIKNKHVYRCKDCMRKLCEFLTKHVIKIINSKMEKMKLLTKVCDKMQKFVKFVKKNLKINIWKMKNRDHCHYTGEYWGAVHSICNLEYSVPKKIPIVFNNESNYDYHFIIKELVGRFKKPFTCLGKKKKNT